MANAGTTKETQAALIDRRVVCDSVHRLRRHPHCDCHRLCPDDRQGPGFLSFPNSQIDQRHWIRCLFSDVPGSCWLHVLLHCTETWPGPRILGRISCRASEGGLSRSHPDRPRLWIRRRGAEKDSGLEISAPHHADPGNSDFVRSVRGSAHD